MVVNVKRKDLIKQYSSTQVMVVRKDMDIEVEEFPTTDKIYRHCSLLFMVLIFFLKCRHAPNNVIVPSPGNFRIWPYGYIGYIVISVLNGPYLILQAHILDSFFLTPKS